MFQALEKDKLGHGLVMDSSPLTHRIIPTPLGDMVAIATDKALVLLEFDGRVRFNAQVESVHRYISGPLTSGTNSVLDLLLDELDLYFKGELHQFKTPLHFLGTEFQKDVWTYLVGIQYGQTATYAQVARFLGVDNAARAVGKANGDNKIAILVPCHRVLRSDGDLCGYAGGLGRKQFLLALESGQPSLL
jgi:O-6-methylguanine DNA methyltransferase